MAAREPLDEWAIARTKLRPPVPSARLLRRDRVEEQLEQLVAQHSLTLVSAPAGWGKTTATAAWFGTADHGLRTWLTLDTGDDDVDAFWAAVAAALTEAGIVPSTLLTTLRTARSPGDEWRRYAVSLANDLDEAAGGVVLVLDDLHTVTNDVTMQSIAAFLSFVPHGVRVVATTRVDPALPLALLRARRQLGELRADRLRFDVDDVDRLFNQIHHLGIPDSAVRQLSDRSEGWPAVLMLAGSSLEALPTPSERDAAVRGALATRDIYRFLSAELLDTCADAVRAFLLETSILRLVDAGRASAITGAADAATVLEHLVDTNLAVRLEGESGAPLYRYHELFARFLHSELVRTCSDERVAGLHVLAAQTAATDEEAIDHLLAARRWEQAADRIEAVGRAQKVLTLTRLPVSLLDAVPAETRRARPWIRLLRSAIDVREGRMVEAHRELGSVIDELRASGDDGLAGALSAFSEAAVPAGDWKGAGQAVGELLDLPLEPEQRVPALASKVWLSYYDGDTAGVVAGVDEVIALDPSDPQVCEEWLLALDFKLLGAPVDLSRVEAHCVRLQRCAPGSEVLDATSAGFRAGLALLRGDLVAALALAEEGRRASARAGGLGWLEHEFDLVQLLAALARSSHEVIEHVGAPRLRNDDPISMLNRPQNAVAVARSRWIRGDRSGLEAVYADYLEPVREDDGYEVHLARASVSHMIARASGEHRTAAEHLAATLAAIPCAGAFAVSQGHLAIDLAAALLAAGDEHEALQRARVPLAELAARGMPGVLAQHGEAARPLLEAAIGRGVHPEFAEQVLAVMAAHEPAGFDVPATGERLSPRELEVLRLVATGSSNRDVAAQLYISERTVKSHMTAILRKLGVATRTQAGGEARRLGLV